MTATYQHLPVGQVEAGMILSDELLDAHGKVLLPQGTVLTESMLALMARHGIEALPIATVQQPSEAEQAAGRQQQLARIGQLFHKNDPDSDSDWATALLRRFVTDYRLGHAPADE
ncbi:hypothetical protein ASD15_02810 [Massilia sp. Root351]|jgi:hypothetical protein|uniref:hypothetical protein n=1 Tax=Massilia sp. Root351 TaxID=1736522 RepID=UPI00070AED7C|nr:hypothetical protein [Massilia sp. Root351]KQV91002.1 hypothetical protein ASD15_02810 [Massilia sp. Root351]